MSETTPPTNPDIDPNSPVAGEPPPAASPPPPMAEPRLQREAVVLVHDRGRFAVLVALCTLAGVAVGFVLGTTVNDGSSPAEPAAMVAPAHPPIQVAPPDCDHDRSWGPRVFPHGLDLHQMDSRAWLGVQIEDAAGGAKVTGVFPGSPAEAAGIQQGDVIKQLGGEGVATASQLTRGVRDRDPGDEVEVVLERSGAEITLETTLGKVGGGSRIRIR